MKERKTILATCSICKEPLKDMGNNAWPINNGRCCNSCNAVVVAVRIQANRDINNPWAQQRYESNRIVTQNLQDQYGRRMSVLIEALKWIAEYCDELADENADFDTLRARARDAIAEVEGSK
jgi:hypothetical protein